MITVVPDLAGTPSDDLPDVLATGRSDVTFFSVNMSARHPEGRDADFLRWHTFDHRPEHARVAGLRGSLRVVSTPQCRAARAASHGQYDAVDHVMTYLFSGVEGLDSGVALSKALGRAGRMPFSLPPIERGGAPAGELADIPGVGGTWWGSSEIESKASAAAPLQVTYCFLDDDPVATAKRLSPALENGGPTAASSRDWLPRSTRLSASTATATCPKGLSGKWTVALDGQSHSPHRSPVAARPRLQLD